MTVEKVQLFTVWYLGVTVVRVQANMACTRVLALTLTGLSTPKTFSIIVVIGNGAKMEGKTFRDRKAPDSLPKRLAVNQESGLK